MHTARATTRRSFAARGDAPRWAIGSGIAERAAIGGAFGSRAPAALRCAALRCEGDHGPNGWRRVLRVSLAGMATIVAVAGETVVDGCASVRAAGGTDDIDTQGVPQHRDDCGGRRGGC